jgi:hypothetical protein
LPLCHRPTTTPQNKREELRQEIIQLIEGSRKMAEGYMVPRNPQSGEMADDRNTGVIELLGLHRVMYATLKEEASTMLKQKAEARRAGALVSMAAAGVPVAGGTIKGVGAGGAMMGPGGSALLGGGALLRKKLKLPLGYLQLFLDVKMCIFSVGEATEVLVSLYSNQDQKFITEDYVMYV